MDEQRLIDLEIKIAYQDTMLDELNSAVAEQQNTISELDKRLRTTIKKLDDLLEMAAEQRSQERPPHY